MPVEKGECRHHSAGKGYSFLTDARLYDRARERLVKEAEKGDIDLRQSYNRLSRNLVQKQSRYAHARQMNRARSCTRKLRTYLGRVIRDIERKCPSPDQELQALLATANRIFGQQRQDKNKVYSVHEPTVESISKGKAHKRYEFGAKVSVATTSRGGWFVGAQVFHGNPYDGHTLAKTLEQVTKLVKLLNRFSSIAAIVTMTMMEISRSTLINIAEEQHRKVSGGG